MILSGLFCVGCIKITTGLSSCSENCVILYKKQDFCGEKITRCQKNDNSCFESFDFDDDVVSIKVGSNTKVTLYKDKYCSGDSLKIHCDTKCLDSDFKKKVNSIAIVNSDDSIPKDCIWVYEYCCYGGKMKEICENRKNLADVDFNNKIRSIRFGDNIRKVVLYDKCDYDGDSLKKTHETTCLRDDDFNDRASSLKIYTDDHDDCDDNRDYINSNEFTDNRKIVNFDFLNNDCNYDFCDAKDLDCKHRCKFID